MTIDRSQLLAALMFSATLYGTSAFGGVSYTEFDVPNAFDGTFSDAINADGVVAGYFVDSSEATKGFIRQTDGTLVYYSVPDFDLVPNSINKKGQTAGTATGASSTSGFVVLPDGTATLFDVKGAVNGTYGQGINSKGDTTGFFYDSNFVTHGFLRRKGGHAVMFDAPGAGTGHNQGTRALAMNDSAYVTGYSVDHAQARHGFLRAPDGTMSAFDVAGSGSGAGEGTFANRINASGTVVGFFVDSAKVSHGYVRDIDGTITIFDIAGAGNQLGQGTYAFDINAKGEVTGYYADSNNGTHGFDRAPNGEVTTFDAPNGAAMTLAMAINARGTIAGEYYDAVGVAHGFIRSKTR